jgi:Cd2+/Zn2+-exporting ATPase/Cu+-exporting ATPase
MKETLELTVPELCCGDEAQQIQAALGRLDGVADVRTLVSTHKALIAYETERIDPDAIRRAIAALGMTVTDSGGRPPRHHSLANLFGWSFASVVAVIALFGIVGERLGVVEAVVDRIPRWLSLAAVLAGGYPIFRNVVRALRNRSVTSHALMTLGIVGAVAIGQYAAAAIIVFFMRLADFIEGYTTERSREAIKALLDLAPQTARVERDGSAEDVPAEQVGQGEVVLVKPGERIPVDGAVIDGRASVNQASITGESVPIERQPGDPVFAATICERGALRIRTDRVGRDTTFGQIVRLVEQAEAAKAPVQRFADRFTAYYIPVVLVVAAATFGLTGNATAAVATVLVACSCAIAMATPITVLAAVGHGARRGIVIKGGRYLEALARVDTLVMDKTGTLTVGRPEITDVVAAGDVHEDEVLALAAEVARQSEHPLAAGIVRAAGQRGLPPLTIQDFEAFPGEGITALVGSARVWVGTEHLMKRAGIEVDTEFRSRVEHLAGAGKSVALVARDRRLIGAIALADTLRPEVGPALEAVRALGVRHLLLLTGDRPEVARALADGLGLEFEAGVLPDGKIRAIERLQRQGRVVAMIGDGVNDAPALAQADVGIAMGVAGTDVAIEAAHVALMRDDWRAVPEAIRIGRRAFRTIKQNLWFTAAYNVVGIVLAATGWLPPVAAAAAQSLPDVAVMLNSARLRGAR